MGLETQRSDTPEFTRKKLMDMLNLILRTNTGKIKIQSILDFVSDVENQIMEKIQERSVSLGKPISFSKELDQYSNLPQHIKAMQIWNGIMGEDFYPGQKGYLFKIQGIDASKLTPHQEMAYAKFMNTTTLKKLDAIGIPQHLDNVPECFIIDVKHLINICWRSITDRILEPVVSVNAASMETF